MKKLNEKTTIYQTESPLFNEHINPIITPINLESQKVIYNLDLNSYDKGYKPYYPSMDPKFMGGEITKSKKKIKTEDKKIDSESNFKKLISAYAEEEI